MLKRFITFFLVLLMVLTSVSCSKKVETTEGTTTATEETATEETAAEETTTETEATTSEIDNTPYEIDWFVNLSWWKWNGLEWGQDLVSKTLQEKFGVKINFIVPATDGSEQLSTMIATDTLPDIITVDGWWSSEKRLLTNQLASEGYIWALNDLIEQYAPSMKDVIREDMFNWHAEEDGKTYLLQNYSYGKKDLKAGEQLLPNGGLVVRKDIWESIGSPDMTTPEGFLAACEKVKNEVKTYDGQNIIPIQMYEGVGNSALWLSQYFATPYEDADGNWSYDFTHENYKDSLKFLNDAYLRKLITDDNFSDTRDLVNEKVASGRVFALIAAPQDFTAPFGTLYDADNNATYMSVPLKNYKGEDPVLQDLRGFGWLNTAITKNTEYPERIIKLFEFLLSDEGQILCAYGVEGVTFDFVEIDGVKKIEMRQEYKDAAANDDAKKYALGALMMLDNWALRRQWEVQSTDPRVLATTDTFIKAGLEKYSYDYSANALKIDPTDPRMDEMTGIKVQMDELRKRAVAEIIISKDAATFEENYTKAVAELEALGLDKLIEFNNEAFQTAKKALGIERSWKTLNN